MVLGEGENFFSREKSRNVGFGIFSFPLSAVALCKGGNPFQEKQDVFLVEDSTLSVTSTCRTGSYEKQTPDGCISGKANSVVQFMASDISERDCLSWRDFSNPDG